MRHCSAIKDTASLLFVLIAVSVTSSFSHASSEECILKMGYRTTARPPMIGAVPDNSGLYSELYTEVARMIGCKLEIHRYPKKRVLLYLQRGLLDFYPALDFTQKRGEYIYYMENGLPGGNVGISRPDFSYIENLAQLKGHTLLMTLGQPDWLEGLPWNHSITVYKVNEATLEHAIDMISMGRGDFYIYGKQNVDFYIKKHGMGNFIVHEYCCGGYKPYYIGFSKHSSHFKSVLNPRYSPDKPVSVENYPGIVDQQSVAGKAGVALQTLYIKGWTKKLYEKYFH